MTIGFKPAKRGDLCVIVETHHDYVIGEGSRVRIDACVAVVAGIDRLGYVKRITTAWGGPHALPKNAKVFVASKSDIDVDAAFAAAKAHVWPGTTQPMNFDSVAAAREFVRPYARSREVMPSAE